MVWELATRIGGASTVCSRPVASTILNFRVGFFMSPRLLHVETAIPKTRPKKVTLRFRGRGRRRWFIRRDQESRRCVIQLIGGSASWRTVSCYQPGWDHADVFGIFDRLGDQAMRANRLIAA